MKAKTHALASGLIFLLVFILHGLRIIFGWHAEIGGWEVPIYISWIVVVIVGYLSYHGLRLGGYLK